MDESLLNNMGEFKRNFAVLTVLVVLVVSPIVKGSNLFVIAFNITIL